MATSVRYFYDAPNADVVELDRLQGMPNGEVAARWPGLKIVRFDGFDRMVGYAAGTARKVENLLPATRKVEFNTAGSKHECNSKCMNATGHQCECSCGGKNHGHGAL